MARRHPKRLIVIDIMTANAARPMSEVVPMIQAAIECSPNQARAWYVWIVERDFAPGVVEYKRKKSAGVPVALPAADAAALAAADAVADEAEFAAADALRAYVDEVRAAE